MICTVFTTNESNAGIIVSAAMIFVEIAITDDGIILSLDTINNKNQENDGTQAKCWSAHFDTGANQWN